MRHALIHATLVVASLLAYRFLALGRAGAPRRGVPLSATAVVPMLEAGHVESAVGRPIWPLSVIVRWLDRWLTQWSGVVRRFLGLSRA